MPDDDVGSDPRPSAAPGRRDARRAAGRARARLVAPLGTGRAVGTARSREPASGATVAPGPAQPDDAPVAAWLAWMPGGFPEGFRTQIAADPAFDATVVVAGDTRWMTASRDADGEVVDRPEPPFRDPDRRVRGRPRARTRPSCPTRSETTSWERSSEARPSWAPPPPSSGDSEPGGTLTFDGETVTVGVVAPDELVGWSEVLVNREVGARLGIEHDRYLLARGDDLDDGLVRTCGPRPPARRHALAYRGPGRHAVRPGRLGRESAGRDEDRVRGVRRDPSRR